MMRQRSMLIAIGLLAATVAGPAMAQDPTPSHVPAAASFITDLSAFGLPDEARLAADAGLEVADVLPAPPDMTFEGVAARAASLVTATDVADWNLGPLSERLEYDPMAAFEFVRDSIGYDPYTGVLRGALGTLLARAGNDIDRALLLQALLDRMVVPSRIVVGTLDDPTTSSLLARSFQPPTRPLSRVPIDSREIGDLSALEARAHRDYAMVRQAIGDRDSGMDGSANASATSEARQHVWVQMRFGTGWLDLDPTMPDSRPGSTLAPVTTILDGIPDEWRHTVTVRLIAEVLSAGSLSEQTVLEHQLNAAAAARQDIFLTLSPVGDSLGDTINAVLGAGAGWRPTLFVGEESFAGDPFPVIPESDIFGGTSEGGPEFSSLRLEVTVEVPGSDAETITRTLVDRLTRAARASSTIAQDELAPLTMRQRVPVELGAVQHIQVSTGGFDARGHQVWRQVAAVFSELLAADPTLASEYGFPAALLPMTIADESLVQASERLIADGLDGDPGIRAYVARPRIFLTSVGAAADDGRITTGTDLMTDTVRVLLSDDQDPAEAAHRQLWYGTLEGALESQFLLSRIAAGRMTGGQLQGVSFGLDGPPTLLSPDPTRSTLASHALAEDLAGGSLAVVPGDSTTAIAWWSIDPATGATQALLDPGTGGGNYVNGSPGGIFSVDPNSVPKTPAEMRELMRQAVAQVEGGRPPPRATCVGGHEYGSLVCNALMAAAAFFVLGAVVGVVYWIVS